MLLAGVLLLGGAAGLAGHHPVVRTGTSIVRPSRTGATTVNVRCGLTDLPSGWKEVTDKDSGKPYYYNAATGVTQWQRPAGSRFADVSSDGPRALTPGCSWRVRSDLTATGCATPVTVTAVVRFAEEEGFEPPQGSLFVESCVPEGALVLGEQKTRWLLSEDPEDQGDSLWIWGLFKEPLYPFILFELELAQPLQMPVEGVSLPAGPLCFQVDHRRKDGGVQLGEGAATYKVTEKIAADLVGLSEVTYDEPVPCGKIRFLDTVDSISKSFV